MKFKRKCKHEFRYLERLTSDMRLFYCIKCLAYVPKWDDMNKKELIKYIIVQNKNYNKEWYKEKMKGGKNG